MSSAKAAAINGRRDEKKIAKSSMKENNIGIKMAKIMKIMA